jgi:hypothetical protein
MQQKSVLIITIQEESLEYDGVNLDENGSDRAEKVLDSGCMI